MNYPLLSEYVEAIKSAEDNFSTQTNLCPVLDGQGTPVMTSGNFAVVFKMKDKQTSKLYAVRCFLKDQPNRAESYTLIADELKYVSSAFLVNFKYLDKELFVDAANSDEEEFPVLLMDWVGGINLGKYISRHKDNQYTMRMLAYKFSKLAMWLMPQPFAHGDIKPDNIMVRDDGSLVLIDYDGMYVPAMKGQNARELGSPDFRHPSRTEDDFDEHIDDFSLISILLSLRLIAEDSLLLDKYGASDRLLFSKNDYYDISSCRFLKDGSPFAEKEINELVSIFILVLGNKDLSCIPLSWLNIAKPENKMSEEEYEAMVNFMKEAHAPYETVRSWTFKDFAKDFVKCHVEPLFYSPTQDLEDACVFEDKEGKRTIAYAELSDRGILDAHEIKNQMDNLTIELRKSGHYMLCGYKPETQIAGDDDLPF